jgi:uncharacterized protein (TIGR02599 family)
MELLQPSESLSVYQNPTQTTWFTQPITGSYDKGSNFVVAENVIALLIWPKNSAGDQANGSTALTTDYSYDTRSTANSNLTFNQLPPIVQVTMVVLDEASAIRLNNPSTAPNATVGLTQGGTPLFTSATYTTPNQLQKDLGSPTSPNTMEWTLTANHLNYHVYQTEVAIGGAKWSH